MFRVELHEYIERIISVFYRVGFWHREDEPTVRQMRLKFLYSFSFFLFVVSMIAGAFESDDLDGLIFLVEYSLIVTIVLVKLLYIIWRQKEILQLLDRICSYSVEDDESYIHIKDKLKISMKLVAVFFSLVHLSGLCIVLIVPFIDSERKLFFDIGFPLDYKNDEFAYWIAFTFIFSQVYIGAISTLLSAIVWYLMTNCALRFEVLGQQIKTMGQVKSFERIAITNGRKIPDAERDNLYLRDLLECIATHTHLKESTNQLDSFLTELFVVQLTTSALCICCSIYTLAFTTDATPIEYLTYIMALLNNIFDIFMIMNFGNDIELASNKLSYSLFESDWMDRPQSTKKVVLIFGEFLMKPHQLVILTLYPLNLETFTRISNSAYSSFNILQNFK